MTRALALLLAAALVGCRGERQGSAAAETPVAEEGARVGTARVATQGFSQVVTAIGTVTPRPGHFAELAAPAPTRVARIRVKDFFPGREPDFKGKPQSCGAPGAGRDPAAEGRGPGGR